MDEDKYKNCSFLVKKILGYVNSNYEKDLSLTMLSGHLNVSPNYISRVFKDEVGKTLFNYINEVRVEQAKKLMHQQELKIYEIGEKVGFNSSVHFNIVFNKLTGYSPKQYRDTLIS
jgi:YesN/AraC family two-component response regulator